LYTGYTHLLMESVCVTTHRHLSPLHPIHRILAPHLLFLPAVNAWVASLLTYLLFTLGRLSLTFVTFTHDQFYTLLSSRRCVRRLPLDVLLRRFYSPVHMTNCFSYYRFLLSCIIGIIVGGALNTHVELELAKQVKMAISKRYYNGTLSVKCYCITVTCTVQCLCVCYHWSIILVIFPEFSSEVSCVKIIGATVVNALHLVLSHKFQPSIPLGIAKSSTSLSGLGEGGVCSLVSDDR